MVNTSTIFLDKHVAVRSVVGITCSLYVGIPTNNYLLLLKDGNATIGSRHPFRHLKTEKSSMVK